MKEDKKYFERIKPLQIRIKKKHQPKIQQKIAEEIINSELFLPFHCWLNVSCMHKWTTWTSGSSDILGCCHLHQVLQQHTEHRYAVGLPLFHLDVGEHTTSI